MLGYCCLAGRHKHSVSPEVCWHGLNCLIPSCMIMFVVIVVVVVVVMIIIILLLLSTSLLLSLWLLLLTLLLLLSSLLQTGWMWLGFRCSPRQRWGPAWCSRSASCAASCSRQRASPLAELLGMPLLQVSHLTHCLNPIQAGAYGQELRFRGSKTSPRCRNAFFLSPDVCAFKFPV